MGRAGADFWQFSFLCSIQTQHSLHDGLITPTGSFSLTCPPGRCMGIKCFSCYTNTQHCKASLEFLPFSSIPVSLFLCLFRADVSSPRDIQQRHVVYCCFFFSAFSRSKTFFLFQYWRGKGIRFGSSMKMSSQHKTWASFLSK